MLSSAIKPYVRVVADCLMAPTPQRLTAYLLFLRRIGELAPFMAPVLRTLMRLPSIQSVSFPVQFDEQTYLYVTGPEDDLHHIARENFVFWEPQSQQVFMHYAKSSDLVIDVGAYTGVYTLRACSSASEVRVWAIEPNLTSRTLLLATMKANGLLDRVTVTSAPLWNSPVEVDFACNDSTGSTSSAGIGVASENIKKKMATTIDLSRPRGLRAGLLKIDAEGAEVEILRGGLEMIATDQPVIICEALTEDCLLEIQRLLEPLGYRDPVHLGAELGDEKNYLWRV